MWRQPAYMSCLIPLSGSFKNENSQSWYAVRVRSRHEKAVAAALRNKGFEEFLPLYRSRRRWGQRIVEIEMPLFSGYVFCRFDPGERRVPVATTPGVMGIVGFGGKATPLDQVEMAAIRRVIELGIAAEPWRYVQTGQRVRIEHGALAGMEGIFVEARKKHKLLLSLSLLQRAVAIYVDESSVIRIRPVNGMHRRAGLPGVFPAEQPNNFELNPFWQT
jgi:transcription antitermination factor NusG